MNAVSALVLLAVAQSAPDDNVARALDLWNASSERIWSYDVVVRVAVTTFSKRAQKLVPVGDYLLRQRFLQGSWRVDQLEVTYFSQDREPDVWKASADEIRAFAYEFGGTQVRFFNSRENFGQSEASVGFAFPKLLAPQFYESFRGDFHDQTFYELFQPRTKEARATRTGGQVILTFPPVSNRGPTIYSAETLFEITLGADQGYMPVRIKRQPNPTGAPELVIEVENELTRVGDLWLPGKIKRTTHSSTYTGDAAIPMSITSLDLDLERCRLNIDIHPDVFRVPFPPGTLVFDKDEQRNFMQARGGAKDYEAYDEFVRSKFRGGGAPRSVPKTTQILLVLDAVAIVAIACGFWARKRRRKTPGRAEMI